MKTASVIGSTSPLGVFLVKKLADKDFGVTATFRSAGLIPDEWTDNETIKTLELDLNDSLDEKAFSSDTIIWLAHLGAGRDNAAEVDINLRSFDRALKVIRPDKTRRIIFVSSGGSVYGPQENVPIREYQERHPLSSYGNAKRVIEDRLLEFGSSSSISTAILRPGNIYGFESPERATKGVVGAFLRALDSGSKFTLIHGGETVRDFIHVDDVCEAVTLAVESNDAHVVWNVATGTGHTIMGVLQMILAHSGRSMPETDDVENYSSDVLVNVLSPERIYADAGWRAQIDLKTGLKTTVNEWQLARRYQSLTI